MGLSLIYFPAQHLPHRMVFYTSTVILTYLWLFTSIIPDASF